MRIKGCLVCRNKIDKILVSGEINPNECSIALQDRRNNLLGTISPRIIDGKVVLRIHLPAYVDEPVIEIHLATL
jgi:hypothetical protein